MIDNTNSLTDLRTERRRKKVPTLYETDESKYVGPHRWQTRLWARGLRRLLRQRTYTRYIDEAFTDVTVVGAGLPEKAPGPCIYIANHASHLDPMLVHAALPESVRANLYLGAAQDRWFVKGKKNLALQPWYQSLALGSFPILRGGGRQALSYARELLECGHNVLLFPEGTRATGDALGEFKHGVSILALETGVPVLPVYLAGLRALRPKGSRTVTPGPVTAHFLPPMTFVSGTAVPAVTTRLHAAMSAVHRRYVAEGKLDRAA